MLNSAGDIINVKKLLFEGLGGEQAKFVGVKPIIRDGAIYAVCQNNDFSKHIIEISSDAEIAGQSDPFSFSKEVSELYFLVSRRALKFDLFSYDDSLIILAGLSYSFQEPAKPVVYVWNEQLEMVFFNSIKKSSSGLVSSTVFTNKSVGLVFFDNIASIGIATTSPVLEIGCFDNNDLPGSFGQINKHFLLADDTLESVIDIPIEQLSTNVKLDDSEFFNGTLLCQTYYGPPLPDIVIDTFICLGAEIDLKYTHPTGTVVWEDGSMDSLFHVTEPGVYRATVHHCGTTQQVVFNVPDGKCPCVFEVPNAFTPNGDGINDSFGPVYQCYFADYLLRVFNRWGQEVFTSTDPAQGWDGRIDGKEAPSEVYMWHATYTAWHEGQLFSRSASGEVTLLR